MSEDRQELAMMTIFYAFLLGTATGAGMGGALGALVGGFLGLHVGGAVHACSWIRSHEGASTPVVGRHSVMCFPYGQAADCELIGDPERRRWYDVARCSLMRVPTDVRCDKGCIRLMNLTRVRPGDGRAGEASSA
jgi:hypothetical protein